MPVTSPGGTLPVHNTSPGTRQGDGPQGVRQSADELPNGLTGNVKFLTIKSDSTLQSKIPFIEEISPATGLGSSSTDYFERQHFYFP